MKIVDLIQAWLQSPVMQLFINAAIFDPLHWKDLSDFDDKPFVLGVGKIIDLLNEIAIGEGALGPVWNRDDAVMEARRLCPYIFGARRAHDDKTQTDRIKIVLNSVFSGDIYKYDNNNNNDNSIQPKVYLPVLRKVTLVLCGANADNVPNEQTWSHQKLKFEKSTQYWLSSLKKAALVSLTQSISKWDDKQIIDLAVQMKRVKRVTADFKAFYKRRDYEGPTRADTSAFYNIIDKPKPRIKHNDEEKDNNGNSSNNDNNGNDGNNHNNSVSDGRNDGDKAQEAKEKQRLSELRGLKASLKLLSEQQAEKYRQKRKDFETNLNGLQMQLATTSPSNIAYSTIEAAIKETENKLARIPPLFTKKNLAKHKYFAIFKLRDLNGDCVNLHKRIKHDQS